MRLSEPMVRHRVIGLTALIDVVFLLLVFFMLASTFLKFGSVKIETANSGQVTVDHRKLVLVHVGKNRRLTINGANVPEMAAVAQLESLRRAGREAVVIVVRADAAVADLVGVVGLAKRSGYKSFQVVR